MLEKNNINSSIELIVSSNIWLFSVFVFSKSINTVQNFFSTMEKSLRLIPDYVLRRTKDFCNCAAIYVIVASLTEVLQGKAPNPHTLVTSALVGGLISPFVIPWVRAFPLTGNPAYRGIKRLADFSFNIAAHFLSLTIFVWCLKAAIAVFAIQVLNLPWRIPGLFESSLIFVFVNNFRKVATEYLGINVFIFWHPQGHEDVVRVAARCPHFNEEQCRLAAWNSWREIGNGYAFWKSNRENPVGVQYWIAISKTLDSFAILI